MGSRGRGETSRSPAECGACRGLHPRTLNPNVGPLTGNPPRPPGSSVRPASARAPSWEQDVPGGWTGAQASSQVPPVLSRHPQQPVWQIKLTSDPEKVSPADAPAPGVKALGSPWSIRSAQRSDPRKCRQRWPRRAHPCHGERREFSHHDCQQLCPYRRPLTPPPPQCASLLWPRDGSA